MGKRLLVTGAGGLVGSSCVRHFAERGWDVVGIDNDSRAEFFGPEASTEPTLAALVAKHGNFDNYDVDITNERAIREIIEDERPDAIIHAAAQPSHDWAATNTMRDWAVNASATIHLLHAAKQWCPEAPFVFCSTNKVYGDLPNKVAWYEQETRYEWCSPFPRGGWADSSPIDQCLHSFFGVSKAAADLAVQEAGRNWKMPTACLRMGCITGAAHAGAEAHGFLSYLAKCVVQKRQYLVHGYDGKQVRDNIHADDVAAFCDWFIDCPRYGEVYNLGGGFGNSCSLREAVAALESVAHTPLDWRITGNARKGDHRIYYSCLLKAQTDYPKWRITRDLPSIYEELVKAWTDRSSRV